MAKIDESVGLAVSLKWGDEVQMQELVNVCEEKGWRYDCREVTTSPVSKQTIIYCTVILTDPPSLACVTPDPLSLSCPPFDIVLAADVLVS